MFAINGTTTYTYDAANHVTSITAPVTGTVGYAYDLLGRRSTLTYPSGHQVSYAYTARGQLDTVTDWLSGVTDYAYDATGRLTGITYPNGVVGTLGYDSANRLTSLAYVSGGTTLESIGYTLNAAGIRSATSDLSGMRPGAGMTRRHLRPQHAQRVTSADVDTAVRPRPPAFDGAWDG